MESTESRQYPLSIPGLMVPKQKVSDTLIRDIEYVADWIEKNVPGLPFLFERHMKAFVFSLKTLHEMLGCIYATWLQKDVSTILKAAESNRNEVCQKLLTEFTVKAHTLAIDIQLAPKRKTPKRSGNQQHYNAIERCWDVINSLSIVSGLLKLSEGAPDYGKALEIAKDISELQKNPRGDSLFAYMALQDTKRIKEEIDKLTAEYTAKIDRMNASAAGESGLKTLLVVDDMPEVLSSLTLMLQEHYKIIALSGGEDALELIDSGQQIDAFLLDIDMPVMDGLRLANAIRERNRYMETPLIFLTNNSERDTVLKARLYNPEAFIVKPANKGIIISTLSGCLR